MKPAYLIITLASKDSEQWFDQSEPYDTLQDAVKELETTHPQETPEGFYVRIIKLEDVTPKRFVDVVGTGA